MKAKGRRSIGIMSVGGMLAVMVAGTAPASAATSVKAAAVAGSVPFSSAKFGGYSSGEQLHTGALSTSFSVPTSLPGLTSTPTGTSVADIEQAFSGASLNSSGLASSITGDNAGSPGTGLLVQPSQLASNNAYGVGAGLEAGLVAPANASSDQLKLAGRVEAVAPPNSPAVTASLPGAAPLNLGGLVSASALTSRAAAFYDRTSCPLGQPLSFGLGAAANAAILPGGTSSTGSPLPGIGSLTLSGSSTSLTSILGAIIPTGSTSPLSSLPGFGTGGLVTTAGNGTSVAQTDSETFLSSNGDGTYGVTTQGREIIAPITVNLFGLAQLVITVSGTSPSDPITLAAKTTGESTGASVKLTDNAIVHVQLMASGATTDIIPPTSLNDIVGKGGLVIPLDLNKLPSTLTTLGQNTNLSSIPVVGSALGSTLGSVLTQLGSSTSTTTGSLTSLTSALPDLSLGYLAIGIPPRAINSDPTNSPLTPPAVTGGTAASGAFDLARVHLGLSTTGFGGTGIAPIGALTGALSSIPGLPSLSTLPSLPTGTAPAVPTLPVVGALSTHASATSTAPSLTLADIALGHVEASAALNAPITCSIPIIKTSNPTAVTAGGSFVYTIQIPDPAKLADLSCGLTNLTATDTISDLSGLPTFKVVGVSNGGTVNQTSANSATITWTGLNYSVAAVGAAPNPPITLTINVTTAASSPAGVIQDMVTATGTASGCNGGVSGITNLGGVNGNVLTGAFTLTQPGVSAGTATLAGGSSAAGPAAQGALPHTGGTGGLWQPMGGLAILALGGGALALVRRSRRGLI